MIPLPDNSVVIISNCVINLSGDKDRVLREAFRVLKPGVVSLSLTSFYGATYPPKSDASMELWVGCIAGALQDYEYVAKLASAGFDDVYIDPTRVYNIEDARQFLTGEGIDVNAVAPQVQNKFMSAFIRAIKPAKCCAPDCCS
jgi:SAM-dependent methyltransferase